jgi:hypothetical protein
MWGVRELHMTADRIIAVGLLTQSDLDRLGSQFTRVWPVSETPCFNSMLQAIDEADRELWREQDRSHRAGAAEPEILMVQQIVPR